MSQSDKVLTIFLKKHKNCDFFKITPKIDLKNLKILDFTIFLKSFKFLINNTRKFLFFIFFLFPIKYTLKCI